MGELTELQAQRVGEHADETGQSGHFPGRVEHKRESVYPEETCHEAEQAVRNRAELELYEVRRMELEGKGGDPAGEGCHGDHEQGIGQTLEAGTHVELGKVYAAGDEREPWNDEQHGADVARLVGLREERGPDEVAELITADIGAAGEGDAGNDTSDKGDVLVEHTAAEPVAEAGADEGKNHLRETAAEQKCECAARDGRCETHIPRLVVAGLLVDFVQNLMDLLHGQLVRLLGEFPDEDLQRPELVGVDTGSVECQALAVGLTAVKAGVVQGEESDVGGAGDAQ